MSDPLSPDAVPYTPSGVRKAGLVPAPAPATLARWRTRGVRGVRMDTFLRGGRRYVLRSAIVAFIEAVTAVGNDPASQVRRSDNRSVEKATKKLKDEGL